jgi:hypothetical protein
MRPPAASPTNLRKPEVTAPAQRLRQVGGPPRSSIDSFTWEIPKIQAGPKKHRKEVLHAESKSKLWAAPVRPAPTEDQLRKIGEDAIAAFVAKNWAK